MMYDGTAELYEDNTSDQTISQINIWNSTLLEIAQWFPNPTLYLFTCKRSI